MGSPSDRYPSHPLDGPAQFAVELREIWRHIQALEGAPQVGSQLTVIDGPSGSPVVQAGLLADGSYGLEVTSPTLGWDMIRATTEGWTSPHLDGDSYDPSATKIVTSGTFADQWAVIFGAALGPGVELNFHYSVDAATTGEARITAGNTTNVLTLAAGSSAVSAYCRWLHGATVGTGPLDIRLQVRRSAGAGNVTVYPMRGWIQDPNVCTSGGTFV